MQTLTILIDVPNELPADIDAKLRPMGEAITRFVADRLGLGEAHLTSATFHGDADGQDPTVRQTHKSQPAFAADENPDVVAQRAEEALDHDPALSPADGQVSDPANG